MNHDIISFYREHKGFILILVLLHLIFFCVKIYLGDFFLNDSYEYYNLAENIKTNFIFYSADLNQDILLEEYTKRPPVYGIFVLLFSFFLKSKIAILVFQNIISIISILLTISLFKNYSKAFNQAIFLVLVSASLTQFFYSNYIMSEILFQFLIVLLCYLFHKIVTLKSLRYLLYFQGVIILLFLTKPVFYLFIIPNILIGLWFSRYIKRAYLVSVIPILALVLYMTWNQSRTGSFEVSSIQNINLVNYNLKYFHTNKYGADYAQEVNRKIHSEASKKNTFAERQKLLKSLTLDYINKDMMSYVFFHLKGSARQFFDPGRFDVYNFFEFEKTEEVGFLSQLNSGGLSGAFQYFKQQPILIVLLLPIILLFNVLKAFGFARFWIKNYTSIPPLYWFSLLLIIYIVGLTGPLGSTRFLLPVLPLYCVFATIGISRKRIMNP